MLILMRRTGEGVRIGDDIRITVVEVDGNKVRLGFDAPRGVTILRSELVNKPRGQKGEGDAAEGK